MPLPRDADVACSDWQGRRDGEPDVYLLVPDGNDMGIKWREGLLQFKGRVAAGDVTDFAGHAGRIERWVKWSYPGLPRPWSALFSAAYNETGRRTIAVHKERRLRLVRVDDDGGALEIETGEIVARGVVVELTDIRLADRDCCSVAFEAFPDDAVTARAFDAIVAAFLGELAAPQLTLADCASYPAWLAELTTLQ